MALIKLVGSFFNIIWFLLCAVVWSGLAVGLVFSVINFIENIPDLMDQAIAAVGLGSLIIIIFLFIITVMLARK